MLKLFFFGGVGLLVWLGLAVTYSAELTKFTRATDKFSNHILRRCELGIPANRHPQCPAYYCSVLIILFLACRKTENISRREKG